MSFHHYLPLSEALFDDGFYLTSAGASLIPPNTSYPPPGHPHLYDFSWQRGRVMPDFGIVLISQGSGEFEADGYPLTQLTAGTVILLFPGVWHRFRPLRSTGWEEKWIQFHGEAAHHIQERGLLSLQQPLIRPAHLATFAAQLDLLLAAIHAAPSANCFAWSLQAQGLIPLLAEPVRAIAPSPTASSLTERALRYMYEHSHRLITVQDIADFLGVGRRTLERQWAAQQPDTLLERIAECRFARAARLLDETELPLKTIVDLAGFGSLESMRRIFVARTNQSPDAYRQAQRANRAAVTSRRRP